MSWFLVSNGVSSIQEKKIQNLYICHARCMYLVQAYYTSSPRVCVCVCVCAYEMNDSIDLNCLAIVQCLWNKHNIDMF